MPNPHIGPALDIIEKLGFISKKSRDHRPAPAHMDAANRLDAFVEFART